MKPDAFTSPAYHLKEELSDLLFPALSDVTCVATVEDGVLIGMNPVDRQTLLTTLASVPGFYPDEVHLGYVLRDRVIIWIRLEHMEVSH